VIASGVDGWELYRHVRFQSIPVAMGKRREIAC
jgi:hypothetical protein